MRGAVQRAIVAVACVALLTRGAMAAAATYGVDWTRAVATSAFPAVATYNPSNVDLGTCVCDLTAGTCDNNCYCDPNCLTQDKAGFTYALVEQPKAYSVAHCVDADLVEVNARGGLAYTVVNNVLCVSKDNNPSQGQFYSAPTTDAAELASLLVFARLLKPYTFAPYVPSTDPAHPSIAYTPGDPLLAIRYDGAAYGAFGRRLVLPTPGVGGVCSDSGSVMYERDVQNRQCVRVSDDLATDCSTRGLFSASRYVQNIYISEEFTAWPSGPNRVPLWVTYIRESNGTITTPSTNETAYSGPISEPTYNLTGGCSCDNALQSIEFQIVRSWTADHTVITSATAIVTLGTAYGQFDAASQKCYGAITQSFSVFWNTSQSQGDIVPRSGNPGYLVAKPILFGTLESLSSGSTTLQAVNQYVDGLWLLRSDANGLCVPMDGTMPDVGSGYSAERVTFGEDMHTSCLLALNYTMLQTQCLVGVFDLFNISDRAVFGTYGNAPSYEPWQWTPLIQSITTTIPTTAFDEQRSRCVGVPNVFNLEILYAPTGAVGNEQYKILTARVTTSSTTWEYAHEREAAATIEYFPVRATVTWVPVSDVSYSEFVPSPPNPFPKLDADILYPFYIPSAAPPTARAPNRWLLAAVAAAVVAAAVAAVRL